jgi:hypothetical protein
MLDANLSAFILVSFLLYNEIFDNNPNPLYGAIFLYNSVYCAFTSVLFTIFLPRLIIKLLWLSALFLSRMKIDVQGVCENFNGALF